MRNKFVPRITLRSGSRLGFAIVVLATLFSMFSSIKGNISLVNITLLIILGTAYITLGVYGYDLCEKNQQLSLRLAYFGVQIPLGASIIYMGKGAGFNILLLLPLVGHAVVLLTPFWGRIINLSIVAVYTLVIYILFHSWQAILDALPTFIAGAVFIMIFTQMASNEEKNRTVVEHLVVELEQANQRLRDYAIQAEELAITKERNRLAREIHDGLGHYLTAIHMQIQAARALLGSREARVEQTLHNAQNLAQEALVDVRQSVAALRASPQLERPLPEVLAGMPAECLDPAVCSRFNLLGQPRDLLPQTHLTLYRAAQEGLNNARKHAQATEVDLTLDYTNPNQVRLVLQDNGIGTESYDGGFGLLGIRERANLLNGSVQIQSSKGYGFQLIVEVPG